MAVIPKTFIPDHGIRAVCFDLDGVLVNAADWHKEALNQALVDFGFEPIGNDEHLNIFNGLSTRKKLKMLDALGRFDHVLSNCVYNQKQKYTKEIIEEKCEPNDRVISAVNYANMLFKNKTCVVTNCSRETAELMLTKSQLLNKFWFLVTNEDVDGKIKPHPRPYLLARSKLGLINSRNILAIDDTDKGIASAVEARCRTWLLENFEDLNIDNLEIVLHNYSISI